MGSPSNRLSLMGIGSRDGVKAKVERKVESIKLEEAPESTRVEIRELEKPGILIFIIKESDEWDEKDLEGTEADN